VADPPEIAVIVGAYRRERFVASAVRSVLAQTLPRDRYEILVTKNFRNAEVDRYLAENNVREMFDDDPRIGTWLARAVRATRAPLLAFLDDDDAFEPDRLAKVREVFRARPDLGFYRNRVRVIDSDGAAVPPERWRRNARGEVFDRTGAVYAPVAEKPSLVGLLRAHPSIAFNSSAMVVHRDLVEGPFATSFERTQLPDLTLFVIALLGPWAVYFDDRRLTQYRNYDGNVTRRTGWLRHAAEAHRDLGALARERGAGELASWLEEKAVHYDRMYRGGTVTDRVAASAPRTEVLRSAAEYLRFLDRHPAERAWTLDVWGSVAYAAIYCTSPGQARRLLVRRPTRNRD
jgi:glycosyltransferase involved in cell wall biosynthesis